MFLIGTIMLTALVFHFVKDLDKQLFYYGKNNFSHQSDLPFNINPEYWGLNNGNLGFVLVDRMTKMTLVGKTNSYNDSELGEIRINEIIGYGYDERNLVSRVKDIKGDQYYISFVKDSNSTSLQRMFQRILTTIKSEDDFLDKSSLRWIQINNDESEKLEKQRNTLELIFYILCIIIAINISYLIIRAFFKK